MIGTVYGARYEAIQDLEQTPLFSCFKAMDRQTGRDVRLRVVDQAFVHERAFIQALKDHTNDLLALQHPSIEKTLDFVEDDENVAIVVESTQGSTLDERVKRLASFSVQLALSTVVGVCEALVAAHQAGYVHGDVSGRNVLVTPSGSVKLSMTGYWSTFSQSSKAGLAMLRGIAPYLSPEVTAGGMPSVASDVYAVGVLLYQMLSGRYPFSGDSTVAIATKHASAPYPSLRQINMSVPEALDELIKKCLAKPPTDRYATAADLLSDLRAVQDALRFGRPLSWPIRRGEAEPMLVAPVVESPEQPVKAKAKTAPAPKRRPAREQDVDGMPKWAVVLMYLSGLALLGAVGAWIAFNTHQPRLIELPNVVNKSQAEAGNILSKMHLKMAVDRYAASEKYPAGVVIEQDPLPGKEKVKEGGIVQVVISKGGRFVEVPDLRGRSTDEAQRLLEAIDLQLGETTEKVRDKELAEGLIVSQVPEPHKKVERTSKVKVKVSNGDRKVQDEEQAVQRYVYKLKITMPPGSDSKLVRVDMTDDQQTQTIFEEEKQPSDTFEVEAEGTGKEAIFRVFFDNELVKQVTKKADEAAQ